jgi:hypothetical protein
VVDRVGIENGRTLPVGWVDGDRGDLDEDLILPNCGNGTVFRLGGFVRLDDDRAMCLWDFEVGHIKSWLESDGGDTRDYQYCT